MDRKNINRGFKKLRVWQDAVSLYTIAYRTLSHSIHNSRITHESTVQIFVKLWTFEPLNPEPVNAHRYLFLIIYCCDSRHFYF